MTSAQFPAAQTPDAHPLKVLTEELHKLLHKFGTDDGRTVTLLGDQIEVSMCSRHLASVTMDSHDFDSVKAVCRVNGTIIRTAYMRPESAYKTEQLHMMAQAIFDAIKEYEWLFVRRSFFELLNTRLPQGFYAYRDKSHAYDVYSITDGQRKMAATVLQARAGQYVFKCYGMEGPDPGSSDYSFSQEFFYHRMLSGVELVVGYVVKTFRDHALADARAEYVVKTFRDHALDAAKTGDDAGRPAAESESVKAAQDAIERNRHKSEEQLRTDMALTPKPAKPAGASFETRVREVCDGIADMLIRKNQAYGNSALDPVRIFSKASTKEQLLVRIDDKLSRLSRGQAAGEDVVKDLLGYLVLLTVANADE
jgi:hypothetical protein